MGYTATQSSGSQSTDKTSSTPGSMQTPQSDWALQLSQLTNALATNQYSWAMDQFNTGMGVTNGNINQYMQLAGQGAGLAQNLLGRYQNIFEPLMNNWVQQAGSYNSSDRQKFMMGQAESTAAQADQGAMDAATRNLQSFGINPNSGRYQELALTQRMQDAATRAGAGTQASLNTAATGRQMQQSALQMGQNVPGMTVNALQSAYTGVTGAENALLGMLNTGTSMTSSAAQFSNAAANANKLPPVGNTSQGASQSTQGSSSQTPQEDKKPPQQQPQVPQPKPSGPSFNQNMPGVGGGANIITMPDAPGPAAPFSPGGVAQDVTAAGLGVDPGQGGGFQDTSANAMPGGGTPFNSYVPQDTSLMAPGQTTPGPGIDAPSTTNWGQQDIPAATSGQLPVDSSAMPGSASAPYQSNPYAPQAPQQQQSQDSGSGAQVDSSNGMPADQGGAAAVPGMLPTAQQPQQTSDWQNPNIASPDNTGMGPFLPNQGFSPFDAGANGPQAANMPTIPGSQSDSGIPQPPPQPGTLADNSGGWLSTPASAGDMPSGPGQAYPGDQSPAWNGGQQDAQPVDPYAQQPQQQSQYGAPNQQGGYQPQQQQSQYGAPNQQGGYQPQQQQSQYGDPNQQGGYQPQQQQADYGMSSSGGNYSAPQSANAGDYNVGGYAQGGVIPSKRGPTSGGFVPRSASPSQGRQTDDIPARLNAHEFVIPRDVTQHYGTKYFSDLIAKSRKMRTGMAGPPARPKWRPPLGGRPTFVSHSMGQ